MSVALYMDHHVPAAVTAGLRRRGVDVLTALEDGFAEAEDEALLMRATELRRVLFTHDHDFLAITKAWLRDGREFAGLIFAHPRRVAVGQAVESLELVAKIAEPEDVLNRVDFLPF